MEITMEHLLKLEKVPFEVPDVGNNDVNVFEIFAKFRRTAKTVGWDDKEIEALLQKCMKGDYEHAKDLLRKCTLRGEEFYERIDQKQEQINDNLFEDHGEFVEDDDEDEWEDDEDDEDDYYDDYEDDDYEDPDDHAPNNILETALVE